MVSAKIPIVKYTENIQVRFCISSGESFGLYVRLLQFLFVNDNKFCKIICTKLFAKICGNLLLTAAQTVQTSDVR